METNDRWENPLHPGEIFLIEFVKNSGGEDEIRRIARAMRVDLKSFEMFLAGSNRCDHYLARKLEDYTGVSHRLWLNAQADYDSWQESQYNGLSTENIITKKLRIYLTQINGGKDLNFTVDQLKFIHENLELKPHVVSSQRSLPFSIY